MLLGSARTERRPKGWGGVVLATCAIYGTLAAIAVGAALVQGRSPLRTDSWLFPEAHAVDHLWSLLGGAVLATGTVILSRLFVRRWEWARALHRSLRPATRQASDTALVALGIASALGEEFFFRGLLVPALGLALSSIAFGLLHQLEGRGRWVWAVWATVMGILFGALFLATGSLLGPLFAHAAINVANLRFLRDTDPGPAKKRALL